MEIQQKIRQEFAGRFGAPEGEFFASAGRINLIGEHTDYNEGFVFPGAIDKIIMAEIRPSATEQVRLYSLDLGESCEFGLEEADAPEAGWARYIFGVCREIIKRGGKVGGFDAVFAGNVPLGAGLSSSAALESCFAFALNELFNDGRFDRRDLARIGQATEHNYCGVNCGIMDQFASVFGKKDRLIRLDCRDLSYEYFPFHPEDHQLLLIDSRVKHELKDSPYNRRRESCERAAKTLGKSLRDVSLAELNACRVELSDEDFRRARYVVEERDRVLAVSSALERGDYKKVGELMYETHAGLRDDYEVSCEEIDFLVDVARTLGVTGSRIMGGGFGGCTINLVPTGLRDSFVKEARSRFAARYGHEPEVYDVVISDGARRINNPE